MQNHLLQVYLTIHSFQLVFVMFPVLCVLTFSLFHLWKSKMGGIIELAPSNALSSEQWTVAEVLSVQSLLSLPCNRISQLYFLTTLTVFLKCISQLQWQMYYQCSHSCHVHCAPPPFSVRFQSVRHSCISQTQFSNVFLNCSHMCNIRHLCELLIWIFLSLCNSVLY